MSTVPTANFDFQNYFSATLQSDITSGTLSLTLDNVPTPTEGILILEPDSSNNREIIFYTGKTASTVTLPSDGRGWDGTTATPHLTGSTVIMAPVAYMLRRLFQGNFPGDVSDTGTTIKTIRSENSFDYIVSGGAVLSGTGYGTTLNWALTSGVVYIGGKRLTVTAASGTVTASKDTYFDLLDPGSGTVATLVNTAGNIVANNAASPTLAASSVRLGIIVSGAGSIAAAASVNQGQETMVLPIASSIPYQVTDSLGNLICPRDPNRKLLGYRQIIANQTGFTGAGTQVVGLSVPVIVPSGRKIKASWVIPQHAPGVAFGSAFFSIWEGVVSSGTQRQLAKRAYLNNDTTLQNEHIEAVFTPAGGSLTYNAAAGNSAAGGSTTAVNGSTTAPSYLKIELE